MAKDVRVSFVWAAQDESQLSVSAGEVVTVDASADTTSGWAYCRNAAGNEGMRARLRNIKVPPFSLSIHFSSPS